MKIRKTFLTVCVLSFCQLTVPAIGLCEESTEPSSRKEQKAVTNITQRKEFDSVEERRIDAILQSERDNLADEKKVIVLKEKELKTLQEEVDKKLERINEKITELKKIQKKIDESLAEKDAEEVKKTKNLSLIYAKMAPLKAAMAMGSLDIQLASDLLASMKVKSAAKILDQMDKTTAAQLSITFSTIQME